MNLDLIELTHPEDPRWLRAPDPLPKQITLEDLRVQRYGGVLIAKVGTVIARYSKTAETIWTKECDHTYGYSYEGEQLFGADQYAIFGTDPDPDSLFDFCPHCGLKLQHPPVE